MADTKGGTRDYTYDDANRNTVRKFSATGQEARLDLVYNDRNDVTELKRYSDLTATTLVGSTVYAYDDARRVTSITHKNGAGTTIDSFSYQFDVADRVTQEASTLGPTRNYSYDDSDQLTGDGTNTWSYDLNGNRTNTGYATTTGNRLSTDGTWNYTYDDEGNVTQKVRAATTETWAFTYNQLNQLTKAEHRPTSTDPVDKRIVFKYDVHGNRIEKSYDADGDGAGTATVTRFAYDQNGNAWGDFDVSGSLTTRRLDLGAVDAVFARIGSSGNEDWYLTDRLGSIRDIADSAGAIIDHLDYDGFGKVTSETVPANGDRYKFTAREYDSELNNLAYYRGRYYRFDLGAWQSEDPIRFAAGDSNLYRYVGNNATNATDPSGLDEWSDRTDRAAQQARMYAEQFGADPDAAGRSTRELWGLADAWRWVPPGEGNTAWWLPANWHNRTWYHNYAAGVAGLTAELADFSAGFTKGVWDGGWGTVTGIWDTIRQPRRVIDGISSLFDMLVSGELFDVLAQEFSGFIDKVRNWPSLSMFDKGHTAGQLVGQYGVDLIIGSGAARMFQRL